MPIFLHGCQAVSERKTKVQMRQPTWIRLGVKFAGAASRAFKRQTARFCFLFFYVKLSCIITIQTLPEPRVTVACNE